MAKKRKQESADRLFATFFFALIREALTKLEQAGHKQSDLAEAANNVRTLLQNKGRSFLDELLSSARSSDSEDALKQLFGFVDCYPYTYETVARSIGKSPQDVVKMEAAFFQHGAEMTTNFITQMRADWLQTHPCPSCGVKASVVHKIGCKSEECPFCHGVLSRCLCAYKHLKLGWGGRPAKEWRQMEKQSGRKWTEQDRKPHIKPLTPEQERQWAVIVFQKGCIPYGSEQRFL